MRILRRCDGCFNGPHFLACNSSQRRTSAARGREPELGKTGSGLAGAFRIGMSAAACAVGPSIECRGRLKAAMARILSVCYYAGLSRTRQMVLESEGYEVISSRTFRDALDQTCRGGFDALILCHSVPCLHKQRLVAAFKKHCRAPIISLSLTISDQVAPGADFHIEQTPQHLLSLLARIVNGSPKYNRSA